MSQLSRPLVAAFLSASILTACGGGGSSASAPGGVTVTAGENQVSLNWNAESGVEYWLWFKEGSTVAPGDKTASYRLKVSPPYLLTGLTNDIQYAFSLNGRKNGGEGGPGSSPLTATPRLAAGSWTTGGTLGSGQTLRSVAYGLTTSSASTYSYVAVGDRGAIFRTPDTDAGRHYISNAALSWITPTGTAVDSSIDLKAVVYSTGIAKYIAVGSGGNIAYSTDISNWTTVPSATTGTTATLNAIASSGSTVVAVGDNGTIRYSTDGTSWSTPASVTPAVTANLRGVTYSTKGVWVAVGTDGTVLTSTDASTWTATTLSGQLTAVSTVATTTNSVTTYYFVAVGSDGTVLTSTDASTWTATVLGASLRTVAAGTRLVAMGSDGAIYTRELTGTTWTAQSSPLPTTAMNGLIYAQNIYTAVGANSSSVYAY